ncbi:DNA-binding transcription factor yap1 [Mortierella sp. GBA43]|nr:DNA-binding transcription factor yap1 [Mortierella sp. GBA43]
MSWTGLNFLDEANAQKDGKPAPKKAGRKPLTTEPTNKRKAQNRAAQRAFRERKEKYVKSLEDRIKELEEQQQPAKSDAKLAEENMNLKVLVQRLETENYSLKERSFTFDFPISQPGLYSLAKAQRDAAQNSPASTDGKPHDSRAYLSPNTVPVSSGAKATGGDRQPWTPPSSGGDSVPNSPLDNDLPTPEQDSISQVSYSDSAGIVPRYRNTTPEGMTLFASLLDGTGNTYNNALTGNSNVNSPSSLMNNNISNSNTPSSMINSTSTPLVNGVASTAIASSPLSGNAFGTNSGQLLGGHFGSTFHGGLDNASPASTLALFSDNSPSPAVEDLVGTPLFETDKGSNIHFTPTAVPASVPTAFSLEQTRALFTDFRDPSDPRDFFAGFDDPVETTFPEDPINDLFSDQLLDYSFTNVATLPVPAPVPAQVQPQAPVLVKKEDKEDSDDECGKTKHRLPPLGENEKAIPCPQAWQQISAHPKFDDADMDLLCAEMKSKAKCSGHGPVIPLSEVDKLISKLDQE